MKVDNISNKISFGRVYACAGTKEQINQLKTVVERAKGSGIFFDATDIYVNRVGSGLCTDAAHNGKEIAFVIAGKKDVDNVMFMRQGWGSINGISKHIDRFIELVDVKKQAQAIKKMMKK